MKTVRITFTAALFFAMFALHAAPAPPPGGTTGGPVCWPPPCVPVDNGIIFLIAAGALYAAKKIYDFRKNAHTLS